MTPDDDVASSDNMLAATLPHRADLLGSSPQGEGEGGAGAARPGRANGSPEAVASGGSPAGASAPAAQVADGQVMALVAVLLCTLLRGARLQENRIRAAMMLAAAACWLDDDMLLQRVVPYLLSLIGACGECSLGSCLVAVVVCSQLDLTI